MSELVYKEVYEEYKIRKTSQKEHILNALKGAGKDGITNSSLSIIALRYGGLIHEIEMDGWQIEKVNEHGGVVRYILGDFRPSSIDNRNAYDILKSELSESLFNYEELIRVLEVNGLHVKFKPYGRKHSKKVG